MAERCVQTMKASLIKTRRRGRHGFSTVNIQDYVPESQTVITNRIAEL